MSIYISQLLVDVNMYLRNGIKFKNNNVAYIKTDFTKSFRLVWSRRNFRALGPTNMAAAIFRWLQFLNNRCSIQSYFENSVCKLD